MRNFALLCCLSAGLLLATADLNPASAQFGYGYGNPGCRSVPVVPTYGVSPYRAGYGYSAYRSPSLYARPGLTISSGYVPTRSYYRPPVTPLPSYYRAGYGGGYGYHPYVAPRGPGVQLRIGF